MIPEGVKSELSDQAVTAKYVEAHIKIGLEALKLVRRRGRSVNICVSKMTLTKGISRNLAFPDAV
jgi:hypothetical protein